MKDKKKPRRRRWWFLSMIVVFVGVYMFFTWKQHQASLLERRLHKVDTVALLELEAPNPNHRFQGNPFHFAPDTPPPLLLARTLVPDSDAPLDLFQGLDSSSLATAVANRPLRHRAPIGERLIYEVTWNGIHVGTIDMSTSLDHEHPGDVMAVAKVRSNDSISLIFPVDNVFESRFDHATGATRYYRKDQNEADHRRIDLIVVDAIAGRARYTKTKRGQVRRNVEYDVPARPTDPLGSFYRLRDSENPIGSTLVLPLLNNKRLSQISLTRGADTTVDVPAGRFDVETWVPKASELYDVDTGEENAEDDTVDAEAFIFLEQHTRVPVRVATRLPAPIGRVNINLVKWTVGSPKPVGITSP